MVNPDIAKQVLFVGPEFDNPRGGIQQIMSTYKKELFPSMCSIANSGIGGFRNAWMMLGGLFKMWWKLLTCRDLRIVHIQTASDRSFIRASWFQRLAHFMGRKVVMHIHGGGFKRYYDRKPSNRDFVIKVLSKTDATIVLSQSWAEQFQADLGLTNLWPINNVISMPEFVEVENDGRIHMLFMGLICRLKGVYDLVQAMSGIDQSLRSRIMVHIGGNGEQTDIDHLQQMIVELGVQDFVVFEGWIDKMHKTDLLNRSSILLLPSYIEAQPITILEGMSYGMAIAATNAGGIPTIVQDGVNGYLIEIGDTSALTDRLEKLIRNPDLIEQFGKKSSEMITAFYPDQVAEELTRLYNSLLIQA